MFAEYLGALGLPSAPQEAHNTQTRLNFT